MKKLSDCIKAGASIANQRDNFSVKKYFKQRSDGLLVFDTLALAYLGSRSPSGVNYFYRMAAIAAPDFVTDHITAELNLTFPALFDRVVKHGELVSYARLRGIAIQKMSVFGLIALLNDEHDIDPHGIAGRLTQAGL